MAIRGFSTGGPRHFAGGCSFDLLAADQGQRPVFFAPHFNLAMEGRLPIKPRQVDQPAARSQPNVELAIVVRRNSFPSLAPVGSYESQLSAGPWGIVNLHYLPLQVAWD